MEKRATDSNNNGYKDVEGISKDSLFYEPKNFLRSHCKGGNEDDSTTTIWDVAFEPGRSDRVATCGGPFLCIFDPTTGELELKYEHKNRSHEFFCMSWTAAAGGNFLAAGSSCGEVRLFHPASHVSFSHWVPKKKQSVNALKFHSREPSWLFVATGADDNGCVSLWNIHNPHPPDFGTRQTFLMEITVDCTLYCMSWVVETSWVLVGGDDGLLGWKLSEDKVRETSFPKYSPSKVYLHLPGFGEDEEGPFVDSITSLGSGLVAAKCVGGGRILVFRTQDLRAAEKSHDCHVQVLAKYRWEKTDEFYLNIGGDLSGGIMGCGDDEGNIWLYRLPSWLREGEGEPGQPGKGVAGDSRVCRKYRALGRLPWPKAITADIRNKIIINKVAFSPGSKYIVAATNKNLVAFWKQV